MSFLNQIIVLYDYSRVRDRRRAGNKASNLKISVDPGQNSKI